MRYYQSNGTEDTSRRVNNTYDSGGYGNTWGRLAAVSYSGFTETYGYSTGGLPTRKVLGYSGATLDAQYSYDNEGRMLTTKYPDASKWDSGQQIYVTDPRWTFTYTYDAMDRPQTLNDDRPGSPPGHQWISQAQYNPAGQMTYMYYDQYQGPAESWQYNVLGQMTQLSVNGVAGRVAIPAIYGAVVSEVLIMSYGPKPDEGKGFPGLSYDDEVGTRSRGDFGLTQQFFVTMPGGTPQRVQIQGDRASVTLRWENIIKATNDHVWINGKEASPCK